MFNKRRLWIFLAILLAVWYLRPATQTPENGKPYVIHEIPEKPKAVAKVKAVIQAQDQAAGAVAAEKPETEQECWDREFNNLIATTGFINYAKDDLDKVVGEWYYNEDVEPKVAPTAPKSERFLYALARGGFLLTGGTKAFTIDEDEAYDILMDLSYEDPDNSAPLLYLAALQQKKAEPNQGVIDSLLRSARERAHFNTYKKDYTRAVMKHVRTREDYLAAASIMAAMPDPIVHVFKKIVVDKENAGLALQMMKEGLAAKMPMDGINYVNWEYLMGRKILEAMGMADEYPTPDELRRAEKTSYRCFIGIADKAVAAVQAAAND